MDSRTVRLTTTCLNLRHKLMYVDEQHAVEGLVDRNSETRLYWCAQSQEHRGPDGEPVHPDCCSGGRRCYESG